SDGVRRRPPARPGPLPVSDALGPRRSPPGLGPSRHAPAALEPCLGTLLPRTPAPPRRALSLAIAAADGHPLHRQLSARPGCTAFPWRLGPLEARPGRCRRPAARRAGSPDL